VFSRGKGRVLMGEVRQVTRRGKADRLICNARGVVGHNEAPVPPRIRRGAIAKVNF